MLGCPGQESLLCTVSSDKVLLAGSLWLAEDPGEGGALGLSGESLNVKSTFYQSQIL